MSTVLHRQAVIDTLNQAIALWPSEYRPREVKPHAGRVTLDDLSYIASKKNALLVSCLRTSDVAREPILGNALSVRARMAIFIGTSDTRAHHRDLLALAITDRVTELVFDNTFGTEQACPPEGINSDNRYSVSLDRTGANLWAVTWDQRLALSAHSDTALQNLLRVHSQLAPEPDKFHAQSSELHDV